jgi:hypothetical protein
MMARIFHLFCIGVDLPLRFLMFLAPVEAKNMVLISYTVRVSPLTDHEYAQLLSAYLDFSDV